MTRPLRRAPVAWASSLLLATVLAACAPAPPASVHTLTEGELWFGDRADPPPADDPAWQAVSLPDLWLVSRRVTATAGWYRFRVDVEAPPSERWAVFLPRLSMNAAVWWNGQLLGDGGPFSPEIARNWNRPLLVPLPASLVRAGGNEVLVRLAMSASSPGILSEVRVGSAGVLAVVHWWRMFVQVTVTQVLATMTLLTALAMASIYRRRAPAGQIGWFVSGLILWSISTLDTLVVLPPLPSRLWEWCMQASMNGLAPCLVMSVQRVGKGQLPRWVRWMWLVTAGMAALLAFAPPVHRFSVHLGWLVWSLLWGVLAAAGVMGWREQVAASARPPLMVAGVLALSFAAWDLSGLILGQVRGLVLLSPYIPGVLLVAAGWILLADVARGLDEAEALNAELEQRVASKHAELEANYERLRQLEAERVVTAERDRIMRDMHDGMGGQLMTALATAESRTASPDEMAEAIRAALEDMRLVIDSFEPVEDDLVTLLGMVRGRLEPRLARHGVVFDWQVRDVPAVPAFGPERALQVLRVIQEAVTNVIKHADAKTITVRTLATDVPLGVAVEIVDDGCGFTGPRAGGRGLANMRRRAEAAGGTVTITRGERGTVVRLWLPRGAA